MKRQTRNSENYNFNAVGNRLSSHLSSSYTHQPFNRLTATQTASYVYNANGNLTSKTTLGNTTDYVWDYENRLRQAVTPSTTVNYEYDALGRRVKREQNGSFIEISYDGLDVVFEANENYHFTKYANAPGIDNKLSYREGVEDNYYFLQDHLGSTIRLTDENGLVFDQIGYDGFGNPSNGFRTRFQYTGREFDAATGLYYYRARWYDAQIGRFISEDPIGFEGGDVNLYGYVGNNPINKKDPTGKNPAVVGVIGGVLVGEGLFHNYLAGESGKFFNTTNDAQGRRRHCYVNCMSIRYHLGNSGPATIISLGQEVGGFATAVVKGDDLRKFLDDSMGDMGANLKGQGYGYIFWRNCEDLCKDCQ